MWIFSISMEIPFFSKVVFNPFMQRSFNSGGESSTIVAFSLSFILKVESFTRIVSPICALFYLRHICRIYICTSSLLCYIVCGILNIFSSICIKVVILKEENKGNNWHMYNIYAPLRLSSKLLMCIQLVWIFLMNLSTSSQKCPGS